MPLQAGASHETISANIAELVRSGRDPKQAAAIAYREAGEGAKDAVESPQLAAGVIFIAPDNAVLLLCRSAQEANYGGYWALPGGKGEEGEAPWQIACREAEEEIGPGTEHAWLGEPTIVDETTTPTDMIFTTFVQPVRYRFVPELDAEHCGYVWAKAGSFPMPMHPQVARVLGMLFPNAEDESERQEETARGKLSERDEEVAEKTPNEREDMPAHVFLEQSKRKYPVKSKHDGEWRYDRELLLAAARRARMQGKEGLARKADEIRAEEFANDGYALDRASVRSKDADGHLRVEITPISKANICPYYGREIPGWQALGLEPDRVYNLYRDPEELAKGADTFAGKPVLLTHKATKAEDHPREIVVGAIGDNVMFDPPYLKAPLTIWDGEAIRLIESNQQRELSSSYRYKPVMTQGVGPNGERFDGRMTEISGNHVALVEKGRAGEDVLVQDNLPAGLAATTPNSGIPAGGAKRAAAHDEEEPKMAGKTAKDRAKDEAGLMERLKEKLSAEDYKALDEMMSSKANDEDDDKDDKKASDAEAEEAKKKAEDEEAEAKNKAEDEEDDDKKADDEDEPVSKEAMDAAISKSVTAAVIAERKAQADIREAERFVRPWVGDLAVAFDSAADVYKAALEANGRSVKDVHPSAYRTILEMTPKPGQQRQTSPRLAMDSAKSNSFAERYPDAARIGVSLR